MILRLDRGPLARCAMLGSWCDIITRARRFVGATASPNRWSQPVRSPRHRKRCLGHSVLALVMWGERRVLFPFARFTFPSKLKGAEPPTSQIGGWTAIPEPSRESTGKKPQKTVIWDGRIPVFANQLIFVRRKSSGYYAAARQSRSESATIRIRKFSQAADGWRA